MGDGDGGRERGGAGQRDIDRPGPTEEDEHGHTQIDTDKGGEDKSGGEGRHTQREGHIQSRLLVLADKEGRTSTSKAINHTTEERERKNMLTSVKSFHAHSMATTTTKQKKKGEDRAE